MGLIKRDRKPGGALGKLRGQVEIQKAIDDGDVVSVGKQESLVLAIDASASMEDSATLGKRWDPSLRGSKWEAAIKASNVLIDRSLMSQVGALFFDSEVMAGWRRGVGTSKPELRAFLREMKPQGGTCFTVALEVGLSLLQDVDKLAVQRIILLSDGRDGGHAGVERWTRVMARVKDAGVIVDTVGLGDADEVRLGEIAAATGGVYKHAKDAQELVKQFLLLEASVRGLLGS